MFRFTSYLIAAAATLALTGITVAAPPDVAKCAALERVTHLVGMDVQNPMGRPLGALRDVVLEPTGDRISYGVLVYGAPAKYLAVPWDAFSLKFDGSALVIATPEAALDRAPGFDPDRWPDRGDPSLAPPAATETPSVETPSEETPAEEEPTEEAPTPLDEADSFEMIKAALFKVPAMFDAAVRPLGSLLGTTVSNGRGEDLGTVEDFVVDVANGRVLYGITQYGGPAAIERKRAPIPFDRIRFDPSDRTARVDANLKAFDAVAFTENWRDFGNAGYASRIETCFREAAEQAAPAMEAPKTQAPKPATEEPLEIVPLD